MDSWTGELWPNAENRTQVSDARVFTTPFSQLLCVFEDFHNKTQGKELELQVTITTFTH